MKTLLVTAMSFILCFSCDAMVSKVQRGKASWYSVSCNKGTRTASGRKLRNDGSTAAHKTLPLGTVVKVTNLKNGKTAVVTITDKGPYKKGRIIDVTVGVAKKLGFKDRGTTDVKLEIIGKMNLS